MTTESLSDKITTKLYKEGCENEELVDGIEVKDVKEAIQRLKKELSSLVPETQSEVERVVKLGWNKLEPTFQIIDEIFGDKLVEEQGK